MNVRCRTNLDLMPCEVWPTELPAVPRVGDYVESGHVWRPNGKGGMVLRLVVCTVTWKRYLPGELGMFHGAEVLTRYPEIELTTPPCFHNLTEFYRHYAALTGTPKSKWI